MGNNTRVNSNQVSGRKMAVSGAPINNHRAKLKSIWFVVHATGDSDDYTEFVAKSLDELNDLIFNKIYKIKGVVRTETSLILKYIKRRYDWGTALP